MRLLDFFRPNPSFSNGYDEKMENRLLSPPPAALQDAGMIHGWGGYSMNSDFRKILLKRIARANPPWLHRFGKGASCSTAIGAPSREPIIAAARVLRFIPRGAPISGR
jgi:hypothetical protein